MTTTRIRLSLIILSLSTISLPALSAEPNEPDPQIQFVVSDWTTKTWVVDGEGTPGDGPLKPTYVAEIIIWRPSPQPSNMREEYVQQSPSGKLISEKQLQFLSTPGAFVHLNREEPMGNYCRYLLYAVGERDAILMAKAFVELSAAMAEKNMQATVDKKTEWETKIAQYENSIRELEEKLQAAKTQKKSLGNEGRYLDEDEARGTIQEMNSLLNRIHIEMEGIRAKIEKIQQFQKAGKDKGPYGVTSPKLEEMLIAETISLTGAMAREKAATEIQQHAKTFLHAIDEQHACEGALVTAHVGLSNAQRELSAVEERLAKPQPNMLPPIIYENKITTYPVLVK